MGLLTAPENAVPQRAVVRSMSHKYACFTPSETLQYMDRFLASKGGTCLHQVNHYRPRRRSRARSSDFWLNESHPAGHSEPGPKRRPVAIAWTCRWTSCHPRARARSLPSRSSELWNHVMSSRQSTRSQGSRPARCLVPSLSWRPPTFPLALVPCFVTAVSATSTPQAMFGSRSLSRACLFLPTEPTTTPGQGITSSGPCGVGVLPEP